MLRDVILVFGIFLVVATNYTNRAHAEPTDRIFVPARHRHLEDLINAGAQVVGRRKECLKVEDAFPSGSHGTVDNPVIIVTCRVAAKQTQTVNFMASRKDIEAALKRSITLAPPISERDAIKKCMEATIGPNADAGHIEYFRARPMLRIDRIMLVQVDWKLKDIMGTGVDHALSHDCLVPPSGETELRPQTPLADQAVKMDIR